MNRQQAKQKHKTNMYNKISFIIKFMFGKLCSMCFFYYSVAVSETEIDIETFK